MQYGLDVFARSEREVAPQNTTRRRHPSLSLIDTQHRTRVPSEAECRRVALRRSSASSFAMPLGRRLPLLVCDHSARE